MLHPIIIVDGPDATGKTTWAETFCKEFGGYYIHLTLRKKMLEHQIASLHIALRRSETQPVVIDRHWISEQIYGGVYRGGTDLAGAASVFDNLCADHLGVCYLLALRGTPVDMAAAHATTSESRHEMYEPDSRILEVARGYYDIWHGTKFCGFNTGYCRRVGTLRARPTQAMFYDFTQLAVVGMSTLDHCQAVYQIAKARRRYILDDTASAEITRQAAESVQWLAKYVKHSAQYTMALPTKF